MQPGLILFQFFLKIPELVDKYRVQENNKKARGKILKYSNKYKISWLWEK